MNHPGKPIAAGFGAGLLGALVLMAARSFDEEYAPRTVAPSGKKGNSICGQLGRGILTGMLYGQWRGSKRPASSLRDGVMLGLLTYAIAAVQVFPASASTKPIWRQNIPQLAGGGLRHVIHGVVIAASFDFLNSMLRLVAGLHRDSSVKNVS